MKYVTASWSKFSLNNRSYTFFEVVDKITRITRTSIDYCNILRAKINITQSVNKHSKYWPWYFLHSGSMNFFKFLRLKIRERKIVSWNSLSYQRNHISMTTFQVRSLLGQREELGSQEFQNYQKWIPHIK